MFNISALLATPYKDLLLKMCQPLHVFEAIEGDDKQPNWQPPAKPYPAL